MRGGVVVTIGQGGAGASAAASHGGDGGVTSFGAISVANGGQGGTTAGPVGAGQTSGYGGAGAPAGIGDIAFAGNAGTTGGYALPAEEVEVVAGQGGAAPLGGGVGKEAATLGGTNVVAIGPPGMSPGAGGGGASSANQAAAPLGGDGAAGFCLITEYVLVSVPGSGDGCGQPLARVELGWCG